MTCRTYTEAAWLWCSHLGEGRAYGFTADGVRFRVTRGTDGRWTDTIDGTSYGPWATADEAIDDLQLRLAADGVLVRRRT